VIASSFERIHRSNLVGMGILPCQFAEGESAETLGLDGTERFDLLGLDDGVTPRQSARLRIARADGSVREVTLRVRVDTPIEASYIAHGGILPFVFRQMMGESLEA